MKKQKTDALNVRPHPGLLPRGEGESFAMSLECRVPGLAGQPPANRKLALVCPLLGERKQVREVVIQQCLHSYFFILRL